MNTTTFTKAEVLQAVSDWHAGHVFYEGNLPALDLAENAAENLAYAMGRSDLCFTARTYVGTLGVIIDMAGWRVIA